MPTNLDKKHPTIIEQRRAAKELRAIYESSLINGHAFLDKDGNEKSIQFQKQGQTIEQLEPTHVCALPSCQRPYRPAAGAKTSKFCSREHQIEASRLRQQQRRAAAKAAKAESTQRPVRAKRKRRHAMSCAVCGRRFTAQRSDATVCGDVCRSRRTKAKARA